MLKPFLVYALTPRRSLRGTIRAVSAPAGPMSPADATRYAMQHCPDGTVSYAYVMADSRQDAIARFPNNSGQG